jgi:hypothetical protein
MPRRIAIRRLSEGIESTSRARENPLMGRPWNDWYHVVSHAYGSWLPGDLRGWRSRNHRTHVEGDYKNPPPEGEFDRVFAHSRMLMQRDAVRVADDLRLIVAHSIVEKLISDHIEVLIVGVDAKHAHLLARFVDHKPLHWVGRAKKNASHVMRQRGLRQTVGGLWAKGSRAKPIRDRAHQINVFNYILSHAQRGAAVWTFRDKKANA